MTIAVLPNLGIGNFASICRMVQRLGFRAVVASTPAELKGADRVILAGVGAFDPAARSLRDGGWATALERVVLRDGVPLLGICLGMQLLGRGSEEGTVEGLGWVDAYATRFGPGEPPIKVPHMGWNHVERRRTDGILPNEEELRYYFVHSYRMHCEDPAAVVGTTRYGSDFVSAFSQGRVHGVQFHPEKSHRHGMALLARFMGEPGA